MHDLAALWDKKEKLQEYHQYFPTHDLPGDFHVPTLSAGHGPGEGPS